MVACWSLERAEDVARAFTLYFHLTNLAEEQQRIRNLRERDTGGRAAAGVAGRGRGRLSRGGRGRAPGDLLGWLRVHLVLTAHPTEARRRAVIEALRRISALLDVLDDLRPGAAERDEARRKLREEIDLLWRTSQLRVKAMEPLDEVRTVMTAFDETLFRVCPGCTGGWKPGWPGPRPGRSPVPAFLRLGSWVGADRDGNPTVTAQVTRETAVIQADHVLRALENAAARIGRALTLHARRRRRGRACAARCAAAHAAHPELLAEIEARSPQEPYRSYLLYAARRLRATRWPTPTWLTPGPPDSWPTCVPCRTRWPPRVRPGRRSASCST